MAQRVRPHPYVPNADALTGRCLRLAFPLPADEGPHEETFQRLLDALGAVDGESIKALDDALTAPKTALGA